MSKGHKLRDDNRVCLYDVHVYAAMKARQSLAREIVDRLTTCMISTSVLNITEDYDKDVDDWVKIVEEVLDDDNDTTTGT